MSAAVVGAFAWTSLASLHTVAYTLVQTMWCCSLVLGIGAVALGMQQSGFLIRIGCLPTANHLCQNMLSHDAGNGQRAPSWHQVLIWQAAVGLLEFSMYTWLAGFVVFIWGITKSGQSNASSSDRVVSARPLSLFMSSWLKTELQVAAFPLFAFLAVVLLYILSMLRLWYIAGKNNNYVHIQL